MLPSSRSPARTPLTLPTIDQRRRVLDLVTHLSPHYTKECTRPAQPIYKEQAAERYASLIGHQSPSSSSWFDTLGLGSNVDGDYVPSGRRFGPDAHKYFFAINLYNSFDVIPDLFATLFRVAAILGYHNVYVSIYENGSTDQTKALLRIFDAICRSVGLRVTIRTSMRTRGAFNHRIEYLAEVRNAAFVPLHELRDAENEYFDSIIFMNDILPCVDDLLELIWQSRRNNAGITCAADYMYHEELVRPPLLPLPVFVHANAAPPRQGSPVFYDNWVARDINGTALENAPFESIFQHGPSQQRFMQHLPIQVQSCWNGIAVLDPAPFYAPPHVRFRMARITEGECSASECSLICNDYWEAGYGRILMVPRVKLAYDHVRALLLRLVLCEADGGAACVGHHPPLAPKPHRDPWVRPPRRTARQPAHRPAGPRLVRTPRPSLHRGGERAARVPSWPRIRCVPLYAAWSLLLQPETDVARR